MIEYHTVCIRPVMPPKAPDTYRDKLIARFGRVPSMAELAKLESATHRMSLEIYQPQMALDKSLDARRERTKETIGTLVAALTRPMTNQDLATATGIPLSTVAHLMRRALDEGAVKRERVQRVYIWERANAPVTVVTPKPAGPYAIPVPVRGVTFESMRTCAKHFGISVQAVHDAVKRGRQDFIGLRKQK
jgi:hypothetical protein